MNDGSGREAACVNKFRFFLFLSHQSQSVLRGMNYSEVFSARPLQLALTEQLAHNNVKSFPTLRILNKFTDSRKHFRDCLGRWQIFLEVCRFFRNLLRAASASSVWPHFLDFETNIVRTTKGAQVTIIRSQVKAAAGVF